MYLTVTGDTYGTWDDIAAIPIALPVTRTRHVFVGVFSREVMLQCSESWMSYVHGCVAVDIVHPQTGTETRNMFRVSEYSSVVFLLSYPELALKCTVGVLA